jgi:hypothetical protein
MNSLHNHNQGKQMEKDTTFRDKLVDIADILADAFKADVQVGQTKTNRRNSGSKSAKLTILTGDDSYLVARLSRIQYGWSHEATAKDPDPGRALYRMFKATEVIVRYTALLPGWGSKSVEAEGFKVEQRDIALNQLRKAQKQALKLSTTEELEPEED